MCEQNVERRGEGGGGGEQLGFLGNGGPEASLHGSELVLEFVSFLHAVESCHALHKLHCQLDPGQGGGRGVSVCSIPMAPSS